MLLAWRAGVEFRAVPILLLGLGLWVPPAGAGEAGQVPRPAPALAADALSDAFKSDVGDRVFFASGSASLGTRARVALESQAAWLSRHTGVVVVVEGYADDPGDAEVNLALAQARAETVRDKLAQLGVPEGRLAIATFGRSGQAMTCADPACAAPNRRVVIRIAHPLAAEDQGEGGSRPGIRPALRRLF